MISSVTEMKFGTVRIVAVGVCAFPVGLKAHSRAALSTDFLIKYLIALSLPWYFGPARLVRRVWVAYLAIDSHARSLALIVPHCRSAYNGDTAMPAHRHFPPARQQIPGLGGARLGADCRSGGLCLECQSILGCQSIGNGKPLQGRIDDVEACTHSRCRRGKLSDRVTGGDGSIAWRGRRHVGLAGRLHQGAGRARAGQLFGGVCVLSRHAVARRYRLAGPRRQCLSETLD